MNITKSNHFAFEEYKELVEKYIKIDCREINFQNRVVLQLLERIFIKNHSVFIVDVSTQYKNKSSNIHDRKFYAWEYTPDLLIVKDWNYNNKDKQKEDYLAVVEVKSPVLDPICNNKNHTFAEIENYKAHGSKAILTDCYEWIFYDGDKEPERYVLGDKNGWFLKEKNNSIVQGFDFDNDRLESVEWNSLIRFIENFCLQ